MSSSLGRRRPSRTSDVFPPSRLPILFALVRGAIAAFHTFAAQFGMGITIAVAVVTAALLPVAVSTRLRSRREIAPNTKERSWMHLMRQGTASMQLSLTQRLLWISLDGVDGRYTLTDIANCQMRQAGAQWCLVAKVRVIRPLPNRSSYSAGIVGDFAGFAFGLRGIRPPWDKNMPRTRNHGQAPFVDST